MPKVRRRRRKCTPARVTQDNTFNRKSQIMSDSDIDETCVETTMIEPHISPADKLLLKSHDTSETNSDSVQVFATLHEKRNSDSTFVPSSTESHKHLESPSLINQYKDRQTVPRTTSQPYNQNDSELNHEDFYNPRHSDSTFVPSSPESQNYSVSPSLINQYNDRQMVPRTPSTSYNQNDSVLNLDVVDNTRDSDSTFVPSSPESQKHLESPSLINQYKDRPTVPRTPSTSYNQNDSELNHEDFYNTRHSDSTFVPPSPESQKRSESPSMLNQYNDRQTVPRTPSMLYNQNDFELTPDVLYNNRDSNSTFVPTSAETENCYETSPSMLIIHYDQQHISANTMSLPNKANICLTSSSILNAHNDGQVKSQCMTPLPEIQSSFHANSSILDKQQPIPQGVVSPEVHMDLSEVHNECLTNTSVLNLQEFNQNLSESQAHENHLRYPIMLQTYQPIEQSESSHVTAMLIPLDDEALSILNENSESILASNQIILPETTNLESSVALSDLNVSDSVMAYSLEFEEHRISHVFSRVEDELESGNLIEFFETSQDAPNNENINSSACTQNNSRTDEIVVVDQDFISVQNSSASTAETVENENSKGRLKKGRKRKYPGQNRALKKAKLNKGKKYVNYKGVTVEEKAFAGEGFSCNCKRKCTEKVSEEERKTIFNNYWLAGSYEARCALLQSYCKELPKKKNNSSNRPSKRKFTREYLLNNITVCQKTFLNTLSISAKPIEVAMMKKRSEQPVNDRRGIETGGHNKTSEEKIKQITDSINKLPKYKSHYCRDNIPNKFLAPNLNLRKVYDLYKKDNPIDAVSRSLFKNIFYTKFNLRFKKPQKDTCVRCDVFNARKRNLQGRELDDLTAEHDIHLDQARELRQKMKGDLTLAAEDNTVETLTFDLEKTNCLPRLSTNIIYYKRQLNLYNFGIHQGSTKKGFFNVWLEHEGGRGTQEVGSCLRKFVAENLNDTTKHLILWADSCGGQNKSIKLVLMLMHLLLNHDKLEKITFRFLQPGHTYLPNDSEFGDLECALKNQNRLYTDTDYIEIMKECRRKNKFTVNRISKEDIFSVESLLKAIINRKVDENKKKVSWLNTSEIELRKDEPLKIFFKSDITSSETQIVDIKKKTKSRLTTDFKDIQLELLWPNGKALSSAKVKDLKEIIKLKLIPNDCKNFYNFLNSVNSSDFEDDVDGFGDSVDFEINFDENLND